MRMRWFSQVPSLVIVGGVVGEGGLSLEGDGGVAHHLTSINRAVSDAAKLEALLRGQNPCDRICACSCCCHGAVQVFGAWDIQWCSALGVLPRDIVWCLGIEFNA